MLHRVTKNTAKRVKTDQSHVVIWRNTWRKKRKLRNILQLKLANYCRYAFAIHSLARNSISPQSTKARSNALRTILTV